MHSILVIGAGKIGSTIADMLHETGDYAVTVADRSAEALRSGRHATASRRSSSTSATRSPCRRP